MKDALIGLPNVLPKHFKAPAAEQLGRRSALDAQATHPPAYGSLRERSFSRFLAEEAASLLEAFGAETRIFDPQRLSAARRRARDRRKGTRASRAWPRGPRGRFGRHRSGMAR